MVWNLKMNSHFSAPFRLSLGVYLRITDTDTKQFYDKAKIIIQWNTQMFQIENT